MDNNADRRDGAPAIEDDAHDATESTICYYLWLMDANRKSTALKTIQGRIWHEAYARGELQSAIFPDVLTAMERWRQAGRVIAIYSSGSVLAQQELFRHTVQGDLTPFINAYFDTRVGGKKEVDSYRKIAESLELPTGQILFVSDALAELDAALMAGTMTAWSARPGKPTIRGQTAHPIIYSFEELP